ncbi:membrane protein insertase YidC [Campylobacter troglodytis]|uniref:membrane protein insertase YidC n=1 Tax=Campylobacter troglodytis TaxID=654363 RepID=UPI001FE5DFA4|nr:membrane protein insertase YidC [Campylobacter troglodytis]
MINQTNSGQQKRVFLAVVLSFLFFIAYSEFFISPTLSKDQNSSNNASTQTEPPTKNLASTEALNQAPITQSSETPIIQSSNQAKYIVDIQSEHFAAKLDHLGRIASFVLKDPKFKDEQGNNLELIKNEDNKPLPLELRFADNSLNQKAFSVNYLSDKSELNLNENSSATVSLSQNLGDLTVHKIISFHSKGNYEVEVKLSKDARYFISAGSRPSVAVDSYTVHGGLILDNKDTVHTFEDGDVGQNTEIFASLMSSFDRYYAAFFYNFDTPLQTLITKDTKGDTVIYASSNNAFKAGGYVGAKDYSLLKELDPRLERVIEYGWFTFIAKPVFAFLNWLFAYLGNWGWAIVVLTLVIRLVLFPLTYKSMISMNKLKDLAPKMTELRQKYKGDPQKLNIHMMELYKKHGANPFSGCLPILLQIPIFFAIYRVLLNAVELKGAPWALWIEDLSVLDPYYVLPILMGATMFLQQIITPMAIQDPMQARIMKFLPVVFTFFFLWFPAGLTLYWCVNNVCSLIQQWVINKMFDKEHHQKKLEGQKNENRS